MSIFEKSKKLVIQGPSYVEFTEPIKRNDIIVYKNNNNELKYAYIVIPDREYVLKVGVKYSHIFGTNINPKIYIYDMFQSIRVPTEKLYKLEKDYENIISPFFEIPCANIIEMYKPTDGRRYINAITEINKEHERQTIDETYRDTYYKYLKDVRQFSTMAKQYVKVRP